MNKKIERVRENIRKTQKNIRELEENLKTLRLTEKQLEDEEIIRQIRAMNTDHGDVLDVLYRIRDTNSDSDGSSYKESEDNEYGM